MFDKIQNTNKFKKVYKKKIKSFKFNMLEIGVIGIRALESARLTPKQLETVRRIVVRKTQRLGKFWLRTYIDQPVTKKAKGSRMGKGAGPIALWVLDIKVGQILFEISASSIDLAKVILSITAQKLPMRVDFVLKKFKYLLNAI